MLQGARVKTVCGSIAGNVHGEIAVCRLFPLPPSSPLSILRAISICIIFAVDVARTTGAIVDDRPLYGSNFYSAGNFEGEKV